MLERTHIQSSGFRNIGPEGARTGFQIRLRQPNYRGTRISLIEGIDLEIGGESFPSEASRFVIEGNEYSHAELDSATEARWQVGTCVTVIVDKVGGLPPGVHQVSSIIRFRHPYFPPEFQPTFVRDTRPATIIL